MLSKKEFMKLSRAEMYVKYAEQSPIEWLCVDEKLPAIKNDKFYGKRHSVPVIIYDQYYKPRIVKWDFIQCGWVNANFDYGYEAEDYNYSALYYHLIPEPMEEE